MRNAVKIFGMSLLATVLFVVAHLVMRPAPLPALAGLAGGLVAYWAWSRGRVPAAAVGWLLGTSIGIAIHHYSHYTEGRLGEPAEGMPWHLMLDAARGSLVAVPILVISILLVGRWARRDA